MKKVLFTSAIESNGSGGWRIRLNDTLEKREMICNDMVEFETNIEAMGAKYGGDIEVRWSKDTDVTPEQFNEIEHALRNFGPSGSDTPQ